MKYNNKVIIPFITFFVVFSVLVCLFSLNVYGNSSKKNSEKMNEVEDSSEFLVSYSDKDIVISFDDFYSEMINIWDSPLNYEGYSVLIEGYFTKMENEDSTGLYYFLSDDLCIGCSSVDMRGHFVELVNSSSLNLDEIWSDDYVRIKGTISVNTLNNEEYPIIEMLSVDMLKQGFER